MLGPVVSWWGHRWSQDRHSVGHCLPGSSPMHPPPSQSGLGCKINMFAGFSLHNLATRKMGISWHQSRYLSTENWMGEGNPSWGAWRCSWCVKQHCSLVSLALRWCFICPYNDDMMIWSYDNTWIYGYMTNYQYDIYASRPQQEGGGRYLIRFNNMLPIWYFLYLYKRRR